MNNRRAKETNSGARTVQTSVNTTNASCNVNKCGWPNIIHFHFICTDQRSPFLSSHYVYLALYIPFLPYVHSCKNKNFTKASYILKMNCYNLCFLFLSYSFLFTFATPALLFQVCLILFKSMYNYCVLIRYVNFLKKNCFQLVKSCNYNIVDELIFLQKIASNYNIDFL